MHAFIHIHPSIHTYMHTGIHAYGQAGIQAYTHIHAYIVWAICFS